MHALTRLFANEKGKAESKAPAIITLIILALIGFLSYKFVPAKVRNMKFKDDVQKILNIDYARQYKEVARGGFNEYTLRDKLLDAAKRFNIPIVEKDIDKQLIVKWPENKLFTAEINYTEVISLPIYGPYEWKFHMYVEQDPTAGKASVSTE
jgi:hypothetical protein